MATADVVSVLFTFPGQGAQRPGMLHALPEHPEIARTLAEAARALGHDPLALDSAAALASSRAVQLCLLIAGVAIARLLIDQGAAPDMVAGLSVGAYPAAVVAGALDFADAVHLVARRGDLMEAAYPSGYGMVAIVGLDRRRIDALIAAINADETPLYLANLNAERQMVLAGSDAALDAAMAQAASAGASKVERLAVAVPSHCPLLAGAAAEMARAVAAVAIRPPRLTWLSSNAARALADPARIADDLARNMARPVLWSDTIRLAWERGARLAVEMPTGSVLTKLTAEVFVDGLALCCDNNRVEDLATRIRHERTAAS